MKQLLKGLTVVDSESPFNGQTVDILIENKVIVDIGLTVETANAVVRHFEPGTCISPGFFDLHCHFGEPGFETSETLVSGANAAAKGGFTSVCVMADTNPALDSRQGIEFLKSRGEKLPVTLYPIGSATVKREGKDMAEYYDMQQGGAVAFSDHKRTIADPGLMQRILLYAKGIDTLIMNYPDTPELSLGGLMNEGPISTKLGMKGMPAIAEYLCVSRDLAMAKFLNTRIHLSCISTRESVQLIREAKLAGIAVTCDVAIHSLFFLDAELESFDSNFKLKPPLRTAEDLNALIAGLKDGTIDAVCSDHRPENSENKNLEFDYASFGAIGLESFFGQLMKVLGNELTISQIIDLISNKPRKLLQLPTITIKKGGKVEFTVFETSSNWQFYEEAIVSKSKNSPVIGRNLKGKVIEIIN